MGTDLKDKVLGDRRKSRDEIFGGTRCLVQDLVNVWVCLNTMMMGALLL